MTFKIINDWIECEDLIFILLIFEIYLRIIEMNVSLFIITQRIIVMKKTINEIRKFNATHQINDALNTRNKLSISFIHDLSLNLSVLMFRESNNQSTSAKPKPGWGRRKPAPAAQSCQSSQPQSQLNRLTDLTSRSHRGTSIYVKQVARIVQLVYEWNDLMLIDLTDLTSRSHCEISMWIKQATRILKLVCE
jgi:hypothetical protein